MVEYAVALDRYRSFARAAAAVHVTQPTFSRGVAALERDLGVRLFDRSTRSVEPTPEGVVFLSGAAGLLEDAKRLRHALVDYRGLNSGQLVVGVGPYPLGISVIEAVARMVRSHPGLHIRLMEGEWREFGARLLSREVEVAVMETSIVTMDPRFEVEPLPAHAGCFFTRHGHPLADRARLALAEVLQYPFVATAIGGRILQQFRPGVASLHVDPPTGDLMPHIAITSVEAMREIVARTDGVGICIRAQISEGLRRKRFVVLDVDFPAPRTGYGVAWLRDRTLSPAAKEFVATIRAVEGSNDAEATPAGPARRRPQPPRLTRPRRLR